MTIRDGLTRRFTRWVWETNHDDTIPTALAVILPVLAFLAYFVANATPWSLIFASAVIVVATAVALGGGARRTHPGRRRRRVQCSAGARQGRGPTSLGHVPGRGQVSVGAGPRCGRHVRDRAAAAPGPSISSSRRSVRQPGNTRSTPCASAGGSSYPASPSGAMPPAALLPVLAKVITVYGSVTGTPGRTRPTCQLPRTHRRPSRDR